jgi:hypothetical protein
VFIIITQEIFFERIMNSPAVSRIRELCPVRLRALDDLVIAPDKYGMTLTYALHRGFSDLGPGMTDHWLIFFNADFILADGSWRNLLTHFARGERLIASPSYCVRSGEVVSELRKWIDTRAGTLVLEPPELASLVLRHRHDTVRAKTRGRPPLLGFVTAGFVITSSIGFVTSFVTAAALGNGTHRCRSPTKSMSNPHSEHILI